MFVVSKCLFYCALFQFFSRCGKGIGMSKPHFNDANIDIYSETTKLFNIFLWNINTEAQR